MVQNPSVKLTEMQSNKTMQFDKTHNIYKSEDKRLEVKL